MKKYFTSNEFKKRNNKRAKNRLRRQLLSNEKKKAKRRSISGSEDDKKSKQGKWSNPTIRGDSIKPSVFAPNDLRLIENMEKCLSFFRDLRSEDHQSKKYNVKYVIMSLKNVINIDYGTISVLTAINDELKAKKIILRTILPDNLICKQFMIDSGYLNNLVNEKGISFPKAEKSDLFFFEKGNGFLSDKETKAISLLIKKVVHHLTGSEEYSLSVKTVILEICGNSIEWSGTESGQWLLGLKYETDKVVFTVTDVGKGILETLYRRYTKRFFETLTLKTNDRILKRAFEKKYSSTTQEVNRNKGLPAVKASFEGGKINNLKVLTNNVILHFNDATQSKTFGSGSPRFKGTFYQWEMNKNCLNRTLN